MTTALHHFPSGRTLHVIDIENLAGGSGGNAAAAIAAYRTTVRVAPGDHIVIGSGPTMLVEAAHAWPGARVLLGRGLDGADRALLDELDPGFVRTHYDRVVIASGDHAFGPLVAALRALAVVVLVVVRNHATVCRDLRRLAPTRVLASAGDYALAS